VKPSDSLQDLHQRYLLQAKWTAQNRHRLYDAAKLQQASRVLEVGSGTGVIIHEIAEHSTRMANGIDIDPKAVLYAHSLDPKTRYVIGDGVQLPYPAGTFDATLCHFLLLWVRNPLVILKEMKRVTRFGGVVMALAEPDYGGRIDYPESLETFGHQQAIALENQGADSRMGRKLRMLFRQTGLEDIRVGVLGGEWNNIPDEEALASEWNFLKTDLEESIHHEELSEYHEMDRRAWTEGSRILFVPTFYALGWHKGMT